jgi:hypothetical protein
MLGRRFLPLAAIFATFVVRCDCGPTDSSGCGPSGDGCGPTRLLCDDAGLCTPTNSDAGTPECVSANQCDNQHDICCKVKVRSVVPDAADTSNGACLLPPCVLGVQLCSTSPECLNGYTCHPVDKRCVLWCRSITDCDRGQVCCDSNGAGYCALSPCPLSQPQRCATSSECGPGRICGYSTCVAADTASPKGRDASSDAAGDRSSGGAGDASSDVTGNASSESALIEEASADAVDAGAEAAIADAAYDASGQ